MTKPPKQKYRIFTSDIGPMQFSALCDVYTAQPSKTVEKTSFRFNTTAIALPHTRKDLWPDGQTGKLSDDSKDYLRREGQI